MLGAVHEVDAPVLVDDRPADDGGMIAVALEDALRSVAFRPRARRVGEPARRSGSSVQIRRPTRSATS